jgi:hypothetical protein
VRNGGECSARLREIETIEGHEWPRRVFTGEWTNVELALRFAELAKFDNDAFERPTRYETALWRQAAHLLVSLNFFQRPSRNPFFRRREALFPTEMLASGSEQFRARRRLQSGCQMGKTAWRN